MSKDEHEQIRAVLGRLGLAPPEADLVFLQRTFQRQRDALRAIETQVRPHAEPAHVFRPLDAPDADAAVKSRPSE
jgi:hypothetical protein